MFKLYPDYHNIMPQTFREQSKETHHTKNKEDLKFNEQVNEYQHWGERDIRII